MISSDVRSQIFEKRILWPKFGPNGPIFDPKVGFYHFLKFDLLVFLEIAYSDRLQQCITSTRVKTRKNWAKWAKIGLKLVFFLKKYFFKFGSLVFQEVA